MAQALRGIATDRRSLIFRLGDERFAMDAADVTEVIRAPPITRVPHGPPALAGIANLRGVALPVVSFGKLLDVSSGLAGAQKIIVYDRGELVGLIVDDVIRFGDRTSAERAIDLETDGRLDAVFKVSKTQPARPRREVNPVAAQAPDAGEATRALLSFHIGPQTFALPLESVHEVLTSSAERSAVAGADDVVLGLIGLRESILPVISLAALLGLGDGAPARAGGRIVVVDYQGASIGLAVDGIDAIRRLPESAIDPVPRVLRRSSGPAEIDAIGRIDGGRTLISILSPERLFGNSVVEQAVSRDSGASPMTSSDVGRIVREKFLIFMLGDEAYGLPISAVDEVIRVPDAITRMPNAPSFVTGVINLRGRAVPLIDQRLRFGAAETPLQNRARAIVVTIDRLQAGFIVDGVSEVMPIAASALSAAPDFSSDRAEVFDRVAHIEADGRMILLVDPKELLSRAERDVVASLADAKSPATTS